MKNKNLNNNNLEMQKQKLLKEQEDIIKRKKIKKEISKLKFQNKLLKIGIKPKQKQEDE